MKQSIQTSSTNFPINNRSDIIFVNNKKVNGPGQNNIVDIRLIHRYQPDLKTSQKKEMDKNIPQKLCKHKMTNSSAIW